MLTRRMRETLDVIHAYQREHGGVSPSVANIAEAIGVASTSGAARLLDKLEERGFITRLPNRARSITIIRGIDDDPAPPPTYYRFDDDSKSFVMLTG